MGLFSFFSKKQPEATSVAEAMSGTVNSAPARSKGRSSDKQNEQLVPEKKRARRRLVGAVALVLAIVIGLPMVLDSEPKPLSKDITIQIPTKPVLAPSAPTDPKEEMVTELPEKSTKQVAGPKSEPSIAATEKPVVTASPAEDVVPDAPTEMATTLPEDVAPKPAPPKPVTPKPAAPKSITAKSIAAKSVRETMALPEPEVKSSTVKNKNKGNADKVNADPIVTHAADQSASKLSNADDAAETSRAMAILENGAAPPTKPVVIQVAAFGTHEKAQELQDKLAAAGLKSYTQKITTTSGEVIRVRLGPFAHHEDAEKAKEKLSKLGLSGTLVSK